MENLERMKQLSNRLTSTEYDLAQANALLAAIVQGADEAILTKDFYGIITSWNPAAEEVYGWRAEEAIGQHVSLIVPEDKRDELQEIMKKVQDGEPSKLETVRLRKDGKRLNVKITVSPVRSARGDIVGASSIAHPANWQWEELEAAKEAREAAHND